MPFLARFPGRIPPAKTCAGIGSVLDILPTLSRLCDVPLPKNPADGIDIWPLIASQKPELERDALLYFDNIHLQCARWRQWKLHVARYNSAAYSPAPAGGRVNLPLPRRNCTTSINDPDESYDVAPEHPEIVAEIRSRIEKLMPDLPGQHPPGLRADQSPQGQTHRRRQFPERIKYGISGRETAPEAIWTLPTPYLVRRP